MPDTPADPRKFIIGWLTCRPGKRDELVPLIGPYVAACLAEEGFLRLWERLHDLCLEGRFLNIFPHHVEPDTADFRTRPGG